MKNRSDNGIENNIDFWIDFRRILDRFLEDLKMVRHPLTIQSSRPRASPKDTFGVLTGLHSVVQLSGGPGTRDWGLVLRILHAVCRWHGEFGINIGLMLPPNPSNTFPNPSPGPSNSICSGPAAGRSWSPRFFLNQIRRASGHPHVRSRAPVPSPWSLVLRTTRLQSWSPLRTP